MLNINNFLQQITLKENFMKKTSAFFSAFMAGGGISAIPFSYNLIKNFRNKQTIKSEKRLQLIKKESKCKDANSDYTKFSNLGFPNTANEKFNICMKKE